MAIVMLVYTDTAMFMALLNPRIINPTPNLITMKIFKMTTQASIAFRRSIGVVLIQIPLNSNMFLCPLFSGLSCSLLHADFFPMASRMFVADVLPDRKVLRYIQSYALMMICANVTTIYAIAISGGLELEKPADTHHASF